MMRRFSSSASSGLCCEPNTATKRWPAYKQPVPTSGCRHLFAAYCFPARQLSSFTCKNKHT